MQNVCHAAYDPWSKITWRLNDANSGVSEAPGACVGQVRTPVLPVKLAAAIAYIVTCAASTAAESNRLKNVDVLDLRTAIEISLADNPSIAAAGARVEQAKARRMQATSRRWPSLNGSASVTRRDLADGQLAPASRFPNPTDVYSAELQAQWVLFDGFSRRHAILAAEFARDGSVAALDDSRRQLVTAVARAFYTAQLARENISIAEADEAFNRRQLEEAAARHEAGVGSLSDALNFEVRANAARSSLIQARRSYEIATAALAALLAIPDAAFPETLSLSRLSRETDVEMTPPVLDPLLAFALEQRPDVLAAARNTDRARAQVRVDRAENLPTIALQGSVNGESEDDFGFGSEDVGSRIGGTLTYTFSDGGARRGRIRESQAVAQEAEKNLENLELNVASDVRESVAEVRRAQEQLLLQRKNADLVERNRDLVEKEYNAGQGSLVRLNEAQRDLVNAHAQLALALVSLRNAQIGLESAIGTILATYTISSAP